MELKVDQTHLGNPESLWESSGRYRDLEPLGPLHARRLVVVAPHPDDEVLGAGGLIQRALQEDLIVEVIAVTDGEGSHPDSPRAKGLDLATVRVEETRAALCRLGLERPSVTRLHVPDSSVAQHRAEVDDALSDLLLPDDLCVAPWRSDGHPDHDVCGDVARVASERVGAQLLGYFVWTWHWATPAEVPWSRCRRLDLDARSRARKRWATAAFQSQTHAIGPDASDQPVLPPPVLRRFWRGYEVFVQVSP